MNELIIKLLCSPVKASSKQNKKGGKQAKLGTGRIWKEVRHHYNKLLNGRNREAQLEGRSYESVKAKNKEKAANLKGSSMYGTKYITVKVQSHLQIRQNH